MILFAPGLYQPMRHIHKAHKLLVKMVTNKPKSKILFLYSIYVYLLKFIFLFLYICS